MEALASAFLEASDRLARKRDRHEETTRLVREKKVRFLDRERVPRRVARLLRNPLAEEAFRGRGVAEELRGLSEVDQLSERAQSELEAVLGGADFFPAWFLSRGAEVRRTVARVHAKTPGGKSGHGTGFLVGPRLLLTNFHVLDWTDGGGDPLSAIAPGSLVEFDFEEQFNGTLQAVSTFRTEPSTLLLASPWALLDYVLVALAPTSIEGNARAEAYGYNRLTGDLGKIARGEPVYVIQHPNGQPKQVVFQNNRLVDCDDAPNAPYLTYEADTAAGSSGSPVFNRQWEVLALHHAREIERDPSGRILAKSGALWSPQMGSSEVKYGELNEGIRISRILDDLAGKLAARRVAGPAPTAPEHFSDAGVRLLEAALSTHRGAPPENLAAPIPAEHAVAARAAGGGPRRGRFPRPD